MFKIKKNNIFHTDAVTLMGNMDDGIIDMTITSPPYDNMRKYKHDIDKSWNDKKWKPIIKELYRVTKDGGIVVWIVGDAVIGGGETGSSFRQALYAIECGFLLHDTMIYKKPSSSFPERYRYSQVFEYMFIFAKGKPITTNILKDRKNKWAGHGSYGVASSRDKEGNLIKGKKIKTSEYGSRFNVWEVPNGYGYSSADKIAYKHPAIFPEKLARDHILTWSNEGDLIFDPFMGSGTTAKMAILENRDYIGSELSLEYISIIDERLKKYSSTLFSYKS